MIQRTTWRGRGTRRGGAAAALPLEELDPRDMPRPIPNHRGRTPSRQPPDEDRPRSMTDHQLSHVATLFALAGRVGDLLVQARKTQDAARTISEFSDHLGLADLEVHQALDTRGARRRSRPATPPPARPTPSREAVRKLVAFWRLWHPISPSRSDASLADMTTPAPHTVPSLPRPGPAPGKEFAAGLRSCPTNRAQPLMPAHPVARALADPDAPRPGRWTPPTPGCPRGAVQPKASHPLGCGHDGMSDPHRWTCRTPTAAG